MFDARTNILSIHIWDTANEDSETFTVSFNLTSKEAEEIEKSELWLPSSIRPTLRKLHASGFEISDCYELNEKLYVLMD